MKGKRLFIFVESILAVAVIILALFMLLDKGGQSRGKVSVILTDSEDDRWAALKYGMKMAAQDHRMEVAFVSTQEMMTAEEELETVEAEITNGADAVILQPVKDQETVDMLKALDTRVPVMLVEYDPCPEGASEFPVTQPDNYGMGKALAQELVSDHSAGIVGNKIGIYETGETTGAADLRRQGFLDALTEAGDGSRDLQIFEIRDEESFLDKMETVDILVALDDSSFTAAGRYFVEDEEKEKYIYGIGNSTEAVYYLDRGTAECLIVPDDFSVGYESLSGTASAVGKLIGKMESQTVSFTVLRRDTLFLKENQEIIFTMSQ